MQLSRAERERGSRLSAVLDPAVVSELRQVTPAAAQIDAQNGSSFVAAHRAMVAAVDTARVFGLGMVSVKHSGYFGWAQLRFQGSAVDGPYIPSSPLSSSVAMSGEVCETG